MHFLCRVFGHDEGWPVRPTPEWRVVGTFFATYVDVYRCKRCGVDVFEQT